MTRRTRGAPPAASPAARTAASSGRRSEPRREPEPAPRQGRGGAAGQEPERGRRSPREPEVSPLLSRLAAYSWRLLVVAAAIALVGYLLVRLEVIIIPVIVALFLSTLLVPIVGWLEVRGWPHLTAATTVFVGTVVLFVGAIMVLVPLVAIELPALGEQAREGIGEVQRWLSSRPFGLSEEQLGTYLQQGQDQLQQNSDAITRGVVSGARTVTELIAGLILTFFLTFFLVKDSDRFSRWVLDFVGPRYEADTREIGRRSATAVSGYIRGQAIVGLVDAVFIGLGLAIVGVPLVFPLAFITFVAAFLPLVGAFLAGALAALVALVTSGIPAALVVIGIAVAVQQVEGHLLAPLVLGRAVKLHPVIIILALGAGSILGGIVGAFLAVPLAGVVTSVGAYLRGRDAVGRPSGLPDPEPATAPRAP